MFGNDTVFCSGCGTVNEPATSRLAELEDTVKQLGIEVAKKGGMIKRLRNQQAAAHPPEYDDAMLVALYWRDLISPGARELNGARITKTVERLQHGYSVTDLKRSVYGYSIKPNMGEYGKRLRANEGGRPKADLSYICRDAEKVDIGLAIADEEETRDQILLNNGGSPYVAALCDCGHPRADHALHRRHGHEACLRVDVQCSCECFDDLLTQAAAFRSRTERTYQGKLV